MCAAKNVVNIESVVMEAWQCIVYVVELDISLPEVSNNVQDMFAPF